MGTAAYPLVPASRTLSRPGKGGSLSPRKIPDSSQRAKIHEPTLSAQPSIVTKPWV